MRGKKKAEAVSTNTLLVLVLLTLVLSVFTAITVLTNVEKGATPGGDSGVSVAKLALRTTQASDRASGRIVLNVVEPEN